jgi:type 1 fimbria pilin
MKYSKKILLGSVLWAVANGVFADTANLSVVGTILPASCTPSFPAGGTYDLGAVALKSLSETAFTTLPVHRVSYLIECDAAVTAAYRVIDNRADSQHGAPAFGYGLGVQGASSIGYAAILIGQVAMADGQSASILESTNRFGWHAHSATDAIRPANYYAYTVGGGTTPEAFSRYEGTLTLSPRVRPVSELDVDEEVVLDGSMTMEVVYL